MRGTLEPPLDTKEEGPMKIEDLMLRADFAATGSLFDSPIIGFEVLYETHYLLKRFFPFFSSVSRHGRNI